MAARKPEHVANLRSGRFRFCPQSEAHDCAGLWHSSSATVAPPRSSCSLHSGGAMPRKGSGVAHRSFTPFHESALANLCHGAVRGQNVCGQETVEARNRVRAAETELKQCTEVAFARACARVRARARARSWWWWWWWGASARRQSCTRLDETNHSIHRDRPM